MAKSKSSYKSLFVMDLTEDMIVTLDQLRMPDNLFRAFVDNGETFSGYNNFVFDKATTKTGGSKVKYWILLDWFTEDRDHAFRYKLTPDYKNMQLSIKRRRIVRPERPYQAIL